MRMIVAAVVLLAAGCTTAGGRPGAGEVADETIALATGPCFGTCPVYRVTIRPDGSGTFEGQRFTTVTGTRAFRTDPATYRRFAALLAPYRPAAGVIDYQRDSSLCGGEIATDLPSTDVTWTTRTAERRLLFYHGCGMQRNRALREALNAAPTMLPIAAFIGKR